MGYTRWDSSDWATYASTTATKTDSEIFSSTSMNEDLNPLNTVREARDSDVHPASTPIIVGCDVTASMGIISQKLVREGIGVLFEEILDRKPVTDPQLMVMGIGDVTCDRSPLQVSQFEADIKCAEWLEKVYLEGGGGGNRCESYDLAAYYAAFNTSIDSIEKRNKKGYLFTIGDECPPEILTASQINKVIGGAQSDMTFAEIVEAVSKSYHYFHIMVEQGHYMSRDRTGVINQWGELMGQNAVPLADYNDLSEVIVSLIEVVEGRDADEIVKSWDGSTALVVKRAIGGVSNYIEENNTGIVRF